MSIHTSRFAVADSESSEGLSLDDAALFAIVHEYCTSLVLPRKQTPWLLCSIGLVGVGKSTVMKRLCETFGLVRLVNDDVRVLLRTRGFNLTRASEVAFQVLLGLVADGYAVGVDADCVSKQLVIPAYVKEENIPVIWVHVTASEEVIMARLHEDNIARGYRGPQAIADYYRRKPLHEKSLLVTPAYTFRTDLENTEEQFYKAEVAIRAALLS